MNKNQQIYLLANLANADKWCNYFNERNWCCCDGSSGQ